MTTLQDKLDALLARENEEYVDQFEDFCQQLVTDYDAVGDRFVATSTSTVTVGSGTKAFTLSASGKSFAPGSYVMAYKTSDASVYMIGKVTEFTDPTLEISVEAGDYSGSGSVSAWTIGLSAKPASLSTGTVTATGTTASRNLADRFLETGSVLNYNGCDPTGATDSSAALQAAVNAGRAWLPPGTYKLASSVSIPSNRTVDGAGPDLTNILDATGTGDAFQIGDGVTLVRNVFINNLSISSASPKSAGAAISANLTENCGVDNLRITNAYRGLNLLNSTLFNAETCYIVEPTPTTGIGVYIGGTTGNDHYLRDIIVVGNASNKPAAGFRIDQTGMTDMSTCGAILCVNGLVIGPASGQTVEHIFSSHCAWDTCSSNSVLITVTSGATVRRCKSVQDWSSTSSGRGIYVTGAGTISDIEFTAHRAYNNGLEGVYFEYGSDIRYSGSVSGNSTSSSGTYNAVRIGAHATHVSISNSRIGPIGSFSDIQKYAIAIDSGATYYQIIGNDLTGNLSGTISDQGGAVSKQIWGNLPSTIAMVTSSTSQQLPIGTASEIVQRAATPHAAGNVGSVAFGIDDGGGGTCGIKVYNIHDGTYSSQEVAFPTSKGGSYATTDRLRIRGDGTLWAAANTQQLTTLAGTFIDKSYTVATAPSVSPAGQRIYVSNESGGAVLAFSDGTNWLRVTDRAIIS